MHTQGIISDKMKSKVMDGVVHYDLILDGVNLELNSLIGQSLIMEFSGVSTCLHCGERKVFKQGYCFVCTQKLPQCDFCILSPEKCHYDDGTCRDESFAKKHCFIPHIVYLSLSSHVKVGITRKGNEGTRWVDQGAVAGLPIYMVKDRKTAGLLEVELKSIFSDKTSWQKMLKGRPEEQSSILEEKRFLAYEATPDWYNQRFDAELTEISYPVDEYPIKVKSYNVDKTPKIEDRLIGIKGQYLILSKGVLNIRKYQGYQMQIVYSQ